MPPLESGPAGERVMALTRAEPATWTAGRRCATIDAGIVGGVEVEVGGEARW